MYLSTVTKYLYSTTSPLWQFLILTDEGGLEERLWAAETLVADGDDLTVGKLVALLQRGGGGGGGHLVLKVQSHVAELLLDVTHDLTLSWEQRGKVRLCAQNNTKNAVFRFRLHNIMFLLMLKLCDRLRFFRFFFE